jgi:hypothetical protein
VICALATFIVLPEANAIGQRLYAG